MADLLIGRVIHYYTRLGVAVLELNGELKLGETVLILGHTTDLTQPVSSLEIDHRKVPSAGPGMRAALKVNEPVRRGDDVYRVIQPVTALALDEGKRAIQSATRAG
jgi:putative protease